MDNFPILYTEEEKQYLKGSKFLSMTNARITQIKKDYEIICKEVPDFAQFSLKEYAEAIILVASRAYNLNIGGVETIAMVPYADMFNHKRQAPTYYSYMDEQKGFVIQSTEEIKRGQVVNIIYSNKDKRVLLLNYGFVDPEDDYDVVPVDIYYNESDPLAEVKK